MEITTEGLRGIPMYVVNTVTIKRSMVLER